MITHWTKQGLCGIVNLLRLGCVVVCSDEVLSGKTRFDTARCGAVRQVKVRALSLAEWLRQGVARRWVASYGTGRCVQVGLGKAGRGRIRQGEVWTLSLVERLRFDKAGSGRVAWGLAWYGQVWRAWLRVVVAWYVAFRQGKVRVSSFAEWLRFHKVRQGTVGQGNVGLDMVRSITV